MKQLILEHAAFNTAYVDLTAGRYLVKASSHNWSGVTITPKAEIITEVALKDVLGNTISFTANAYFVFEFSGRITFDGTLGHGKTVTLEFIRL